MEKVKEFKVDDRMFSDFSDMRREGTIELMPIVSRGFKVPLHTFKIFEDREGKIYGIPVGRDKEGNLIFKRIRVEGHRIYNLKLESDAKEWHVFQHSPKVKGTPLQKLHSNDAMFEVVDREANAEKVITGVGSLMKALEVITNLNDIEVTDWGRVLIEGIDPSTMSVNLVKQLLLELAQKKKLSAIEGGISGAEKICKFAEDTRSREVRITFARAFALGIITHHFDRGFVYKSGIVLGATKEAAIDFLLKDIGLLDAIREASKSKDLLLKKSVVVAEQPVKSFAKGKGKGKDFDKLKESEQISEEGGFEQED